MWASWMCCVGLRGNFVEERKAREEKMRMKWKEMWT